MSTCDTNHLLITETILMHCCNMQTNKMTWFIKTFFFFFLKENEQISKQFHNFQFAGETKLLLYSRSVHSPGKSANQTAHRQLKSTAFTIKLTEFFSLNRHQLASVLHRLHPREKCLHPALWTSTCLRLKLELMLELSADTVALMESKICVSNASTRFQFSNSLNNVSVLNWVQFSSSFSLVSGQISGACQEAFTRNDHWDVSLWFLPG